MSLSLAFVLHATLFAGAEANYAAAYRQAAETGQPLVVLVGAEWCPGCRTMKQSVIPQARQQGVLAEVAFAVVDTDRESSLSRKLLSGGAIPELIVYHKTAAGWKRQSFVGAQSVGTIAAAVKQAQQAIAGDATAKVAQTVGDQQESDKKDGG